MADKPPLDLHPLVRQLKSLLYGIADETLAAGTPCPGWSVGDLLDHVSNLAVVLTRAARKSLGGPQDTLPAPSAAHLHPQWRSRLPARLDELADAWVDPDAWTGTAHAGDVTLPGDRMGIYAANELAMHGWDLARATGQEFAVDPRVLEVLISFLSTDPALRLASSDLLVAGRAEDLQDEAPLLSRAVTLAGRDPDWRYRAA